MLQFCPTCRNSAVDKEIVARQGDTATARCLECDETYRFPYRSLYTLEGAPACGKSTTAGRLDGRTHLAIYEGDMHMDLVGEHLSWDAICELDFRVCLTLHAADRQALFVGGVYPYDIAESPETRFFASVERCALVCDADDLERRVSERSGVTDDGLELSRDVNRWYREEGPAEGIKVVNTSRLDPDEVADEVASWVEHTNGV